MDERQLLNIDGKKILASQPFILEEHPWSEEVHEYQRTPKIQNTFLEPFIFSKIGDDIQPIDHMMLRYGSVSSLRDFHLFGPPAYNPNQTNQSACHTSKKTLYLNQFVQFCYEQHSA